MTDTVDAGSIRPGRYRLEAEAEAEAEWKFRWIQPEPGTGWLDIIEEEGRRGNEWANPGMYAGGPTAPTWTHVEMKVKQATLSPMQVTAHAVDGTGAVGLLWGMVGPRPVTVDAALDPDKEYMLDIKAEGKWDLYFVRATDDQGT